MNAAPMRYSFRTLDDLLGRWLGLQASQSNRSYTDQDEWTKVSRSVAYLLTLRCLSAQLLSSLVDVVARLRAKNVHSQGL